MNVLNKYCVENASNTPDFILASYLMDCLKSFNHALNKRAKWYSGNMLQVNKIDVEKGEVQFGRVDPNTIGVDKEDCQNCEFHVGMTGFKFICKKRNTDVYYDDDITDKIVKPCEFFKKKG